MKLTKKMVSRQGITNKKKSTPRNGATMAKRREPNSASEKDETNRRIDDYLSRNANKVHIILTWKQKKNMRPN